MPKIALLNVKGEKIKDIKLSDEVFGIEPNNQTIYDAVVLKQASMRQGTHKVKQEVKFLVVEENHGDKKEQVMLVKDLSVHLTLLVVE